jgi:hypothetical protein
VTESTLPIVPRSVRRLVADGRHNAFTALVRWRGAYWLAFRSGPSHHFGEADIRVLRSPDAEAWPEACRFRIWTDDRDPQMLATPDRLFLYTHPFQESHGASFVTWTDDGRTWSEPRLVYEPQFFLWKPVAHAGRFYATAYRREVGATPAEARSVDLITSADGVRWEKVSTIGAGHGECETTIWFAPSEQITAFLRVKHRVPGFILEAEPPYRRWTQRPAGVSLAGHSVHTFRGTPYLISRTLAESGKSTCTRIYTYEAGSLTPYCDLPSGGDCSYSGAVETGDEMLVSYYSTHEGSTNIYLAWVPFQK